jgi:hypothetical protein
MREAFFAIVFAATLFVLSQGVLGQVILQPTPAPGPVAVPPQPLIPPTPEPIKAREPSFKEIVLDVLTPPGTKISIPLASKSKVNDVQSDARFRIPFTTKPFSIEIEGPFGGMIRGELKLGEEKKQILRIQEKRVEIPSSNPDPGAMDSLPVLCPRLLPRTLTASRDVKVPVERKSLLPGEAVYDGRFDPLMGTLQNRPDVLSLNRAELRFDFEDPSVLVGFNPQSGEWVFEQQGGFYSNIHYVAFPYSSQLEELYRKMEPDFLALRSLERTLRENTVSPSDLPEVQRQLMHHYYALYGRGKEVGPYQILMHLIFNTLSFIGKGDLAALYGAPLFHGFLPGPFLGSTHWNYSLCEWGDTSRQAPDQRMEYTHFPLFAWPEDSDDEKAILILLEGDEQLKKDPTRIEWEKKGIVRPFDYTDDLIGFFVVSRKETLQKEKILSAPLETLTLSLTTQE